MTDDAEVILEQIKIRTADYYKPRWALFNEKTIANVIQNIWVYLHFCYLYFKHVIQYRDWKNKNVLNRLSARGMLLIR